MKKWLISLIVVVIVAFGGYKAYSYWNSTYNGTTAYAIIGDAQKIASTTSKGGAYKINGKQVYTYEYKDLTWVTTSGQVRKVGYQTLESTDPVKIAKGSYVKATVSQKRVIKFAGTVAASAVPTAVKTKLAAQ